MIDFTDNVLRILEFGRHQLSTIKPSEWAEKNRSMDSSVSRFKGRFSYNVTPYTREIVDCLSPDHPARKIAVMKCVQVGFSVGVIESGIGWIISEQPGNILLLTGHGDLSEEAVSKVDHMIDTCGIRHLIRSNSLRARSMKTGDTNTKKEFPGGSLISGSSSNHKLLRQRSVMYGFIDDFEAAKHATDQSGNTSKMIEGRFASYADKMKLFYISTPELKQTSNIEPVYLLGDQRKYHVPCPCCGEFIVLEWDTKIEGKEDKAGIFYELDDKNRLIEGSVGYICQKCGEFFTDKDKYEMNMLGHWVPTAEPSEPGYYSYHINALYAPHGMYNWEHYVRQYLEANPPGRDRDEKLHQTFVNLCLGETFEPSGESAKATDLMKNIRAYDVYTVPEQMSINDGNGKIVLLTCAADLNGKLEDARLDYEVLAWSESGSSYSVAHGSCGTFIPFEANKREKVVREKYTYELNKQNSVWPLFDKVLDMVFITDTGRRMKIFLTGLDTGYCELQAFAYIDTSRFVIAGLKGDKVDRFTNTHLETRSFKIGQSRDNLYMVRVNDIKDDLSSHIRLRWDIKEDTLQPPGYMNFPRPIGDLYQYNTYFSHFEAEHKVINKDGDFMWVKKTSLHQNHLFDCRVYNMALKDIFIFMLKKDKKLNINTWSDYVKTVL